MGIGNQIRQLRQRRGITQEAMAHTPQAVSKWGGAPLRRDIRILPAVSAY